MGGEFRNPSTLVSKKSPVPVRQHGLPDLNLARKPQAGGLSSTTAPYKHEMEHFAGGFGTTGTTGES